MAMLVLSIALALFSLYRYTDDFRFGGSDGYRGALEMVQRNAQAHDVMILDDDTFTPFFLNENRNGMRWYGLSRDPHQWDAATRGLLARLSRDYARVWLAIDDSTSAIPDPTRDWLDHSLTPAAQYDFGDGVHLILYDHSAS